MIFLLSAPRNSSVHVIRIMFFKARVHTVGNKDTDSTARLLILVIKFSATDAHWCQWDVVGDAKKNKK